MSTNTKVQKGVKITEGYYTDENIVEVTTKGIITCLKSTSKKYENIIIFNIGTDRVIGDSIAPMLGTFLKEQRLCEKIKVMGDLDEPIHAKNVQKIYSTIDIKNSFIIAIDASFGENESSIGKIIVKNKGIKAGVGVGKKLGEQGDISIQGITCINYGDVHLNIEKSKEIRLSFIRNMSKTLEKIVVELSKYVESQNTCNKVKEKCNIIQLFA